MFMLTHIQACGQTVTEVWIALWSKRKTFAFLILHTCSDAEITPQPERTNVCIKIEHFLVMLHVRISTQYLLCCVKLDFGAPTNGVTICNFSACASSGAPSEVTAL